MIDFFLLQNSIIEYTKDNFIAFLQSRGIKEPAIFTDESLDLDKYKADFSIFVDFDSYTNRSFAGLVDFGRIKEVDFYDAVSGSINIKIAQIVIEAQIEL